MAFSAIESGVHGFLLKSMSGHELPHAFRRIVDEGVVIHPAITRKVLSVARRITQEVLSVVLRIRQPENKPFAELSERELDLLRAPADGASNARVSWRLW